MIDINTLHQFIDLICDKWQGFRFDATQKDLAINVAQRQLLLSYDSPESTEKSEYEQNLNISNELEPFKDFTDIAIPSTGKKPQADILLAIRTDLSDSNILIHRITNLSLPDGTPVVWKRANVMGYVQQSSIVAPDLKNPVYDNTSRNYVFLPVNLGTVRFWYLILPPDVKWAYTNVGGRSVYDPDNSKNSYFKNTSFHRLVFRALIFLGLNISEEQVISSSATFKDMN